MLTFPVSLRRLIQTLALASLPLSPVARAVQSAMQISAPIPGAPA